jgi:hypothetical protein
MYPYNRARDETTQSTQEKTVKNRHISRHSPLPQKHGAMATLARISEETVILPTLPF